jgi:hypothetical protein
LFCTKIFYNQVSFHYAEILSILKPSIQEALMLILAEERRYIGVTANIVRVRTIDVRHEWEASPSPKNAFWTTPEEIEATIEYLFSDNGGVVNEARLPLYGSA